MPKEKIAFIINPISGRRKKKNIENSILQYLNKQEYSPLFYYTGYSGHAVTLTDMAIQKGYKIIVAVGGDGTVNEVASALINSDSAMGILPAGSGNGLARHLGIPLKLPQAIELLNKGKKMKIDAGTLNKTWFFCTCGVGFDARIGHKFTKIEKRGFRAYIKVVIKEFRQYRSKKYRFKVDGQKYVKRAFLITIANAAQYGNNAFIAPNAIINDGLFDICILRPFPLFHSLLLGLRLFNRKIEKSRFLEVIRGKEIVFKKPKKKYLFHYDGEPAKFKKEKIKISLHPKKLEVIIP